MEEGDINEEVEDIREGKNQETQIPIQEGGPLLC